MRFEFRRGEDRVGTAQWEGPGQVTFDVADPQLRTKLERYFAREAVYLATGGDDDDAFQSRRRDWTPWEFERASRALAYEMGFRVERTPSEAVEARRHA